MSDGHLFWQTLAKAQNLTLGATASDADKAIEGQRGGILGTAEIVDCVDHSDSPWFFGPYGLVLCNIKPVQFIPVKGALGLFQWKKHVKGLSA